MLDSPNTCYLSHHNRLYTCSSIELIRSAQAQCTGASALGNMRLLTTLLILAVVTTVSCYKTLGDRRFIHGWFPGDFAWSSATSAYQVEGAWSADGETDFLSVINNIVEYQIKFQKFLA